ncbi:DUF6788 family protein [Alicyclobacillus sp. ALC3]|uniref:DUF6788 family protein n=1 Tax=Alicyclobacillus sp. ALC3 TaxID=2796143 RepID=UPI002379750E|nr:DUF6788 family protein [Alicyclobacillus sp. ALC3]WDL97048.1 hypothetical protein JC200_22725 [Alicyclobacillus sp. ALC3]WDL98360.1 hypothetical protein JC200_06655 [Alicyclobacillus sp. ALC3]WDL98504.1 hypothetical protein JC200_07435 [Alicyclobacillus sp. ALC3]WDL98827.1 hypothetical protein JC200_09325 [Alicyclobacillus sp. ALC3]
MNTTDKNEAPRRFKSVPLQDIKQRKGQLLKALPPMDQILRGSLITRHVKCGKPTCHCATGVGHTSLYLSSFYHGKTQMDYVPAAWEQRVRAGLENYEVAQDILSELTELNLELLRRRDNE